MRSRPSPLDPHPNRFEYSLNDSDSVELYAHMIARYYTLSSFLSRSGLDERFTALYAIEIRFLFPFR